MSKEKQHFHSITEVKKEFLPKLLKKEEEQKKIKEFYRKEVYYLTNP